MIARFLTTLVTLCVVALTTACDPTTTEAGHQVDAGQVDTDTDGITDAAPEVIRRTVTIRAEQCIVFATGEVIRDDDYTRCDLVATSAGGYLRLGTGGAKVTQTMPVYWYEGVTSLDDVPSDVVPEGKGYAHPEAIPGTGFVLVNYVSGGVTRGWVVDVPEKDAAVIEYAL